MGPKEEDKYGTTSAQLGKGDWQKAGGYAQGHRLTGLETVFTSLLCSL